MFLPLTNLKLKENQNVDLRSFWVDLRKYLEDSFYPVLMVFRFKNDFLILKMDVSTKIQIYD